MQACGPVHGGIPQGELRTGRLAPQQWISVLFTEPACGLARAVGVSGVGTPPPGAGRAGGLLIRGGGTTMGGGASRLASPQSASRCQAGPLGRRAFSGSLRFVCLGRLPPGAPGAGFALLHPGEHHPQTPAYRLARHERVPGARGLHCQGLRRLQLHHFRGWQCCCRPVLPPIGGLVRGSAFARRGSSGRKLTSNSRGSSGWETSLSDRGRRNYGPAFCQATALAPLLSAAAKLSSDNGYCGRCGAHNHR
jgi:hypothetical protein